MNKKIISTYIAVFGIFIILITSVCISYTNRKEINKYNYVINNITKDIDKCIRETKCEHKNITLEEYYNISNHKKYVNPLTNKEFNITSYYDIAKKELIVK